MPSLQRNRSLKEGLPQFQREGGGSCSQDLMLHNWGRLRFLVAPTQWDIYLDRGALVVLDMAGKKIDFLTDTGATYSVWISHAGPRLSKICSVNGADGKPRTHYFTGPLNCHFEQQLITHGFLVVPQCPIPLLACVLVPQSCLTLCDPMHCNPPGSSVHGGFLGKNTGMGCQFLLQGIFPLRDRTWVSCIPGGFFTVWATREAQWWD